MAFPGDIVTASRRPPSILLAQEAYVVASRNETTAAAKSRWDHTVEVTFWMADPPAVSFCSFHCSRPPISDSEDADLQVEPHVVAAEGRFVLLCTRFASGDGECEYFMYKGDVKSPSLECIPLREDFALDGITAFGILPLGESYLLVGFYDYIASLDCALLIYSSDDKTWRREKVPNPCPRDSIIMTHKVVTLGERVLGIVDFRLGMVLFNLLQKPLVARFIPLPDPLPDNVRKLQVYNPGVNPQRFRDLTCSNGVIKFIEMEHRVITKESREIALEKPEDPTQKGVLYDSELIRRQKPIGVVSKPKRVYLQNGWKAVTWTRAIESDCWLIGQSVDVDDILVDNSFAEVLSSQSVESLGNLSFKNMNSAWPILSPDGDDLLYLKTTPDFRGLDRWTVAVDLAEKTLKVEARGAKVRSLGRYIPSWHMYQPCALSKHLNMTPGIKIQAFCEMTLTGTFVNAPNTAAVHVAEPDSCETLKRTRLSTEKANLAQHGAQSVMQNAHILSLSERDSCETANKHQRLSAEKVNLAHILSLAEPDSCETETNCPRRSAKKVNLAQNGAQSVGQNAHSSAHPGKQIQPPQMFFYPGYSWWPHENNLHVSLQSPQQGFNKWGGSSVPGYAPSARSPNLSYGNHYPFNYQSEWSQPLPSMQQSAPIRAFGPHEPPQQGFNKWGGFSVPGYAPSARSPNLSYGNHYPFNYQPEWWQPLPSMQQSAPIRAFGPHEAPRPCFNKWYGASNHGYSQQQLPAHTLNAYGSCSDNGNYQVQSLQRPPIQVLPAYAAFQQPLVQLQHQLTDSGVWIS